MDTPAIKDIRKEIKKSIDLANDTTVKMIYAMLEVERKEDAWTDQAFIAEMDKRSKEYEAGTVRLFTHEEMMDHVRDPHKKRKK